MKVLWFSNTPANAAGYFNDPTIKGGWLQGLNKLLEDKVDLHIAFLNPKGPKEFRYGNTTYHSIMPKDWKRRLILNSLFNIDTDKSDTELYLEIIDRVKPDLIDIRGTENGFISISDKVDIPIIVDLQGIITPIIKHYNKGFEDRLLRRNYIKKNVSLSSLAPKNYYLQKKYYLKKSEREYKYLRFVKYVSGRTEWDKRVSRILAPDSKYIHIDRILRDEFYDYKWEMPGNDVLQIHSTTSGGVYKGLETIFEAAYELNRIGIQFNWNIAGISKNDPILKLVKKYLGNRYSERGINLLGKLPSTELVKKMLQSDIFVMASHIENSPNNLAEAMMLGMPCIATYAGGTSSYIKDGENGILLQDGDPWAMAGVIVELCKDEQKALFYSQNARIPALKRHDKNRILNDVYSAYSSVLQNYSTK